MMVGTESTSRRPSQGQAQLSTPVKEPLQVRIPVKIKRAFKSHAALRGIEPNQLFVEIWESYEARLNGRSADSETS